MRQTLFLQLLLVLMPGHVATGQDTLFPLKSGDVRQVDARYDAEYYNDLYEKTSIDSNDFRLIYAKLAFMASMESNDQLQKAIALNNMGKAYNHQYRYNQAMESYLEAKRIADSLKSEEINAAVFHNMGSLYLDMRNTQLAGDFFPRAYKIRKRLGDLEGQAESLNGMALVAWLEGRLDSSLIYLNKTLDLSVELSNQNGVARAYNNLGIVYHEKKDFRKAMACLGNSLQISEERGDMWMVAENCNNLGEVSISLKDYTSASIYLKRSRDIATGLKAYLLLADNYRYMARLKEQTGDFQKAYFYGEKFHNLDDSLFNRKTYSIISELTSLFELEKKEQALLIQGQKIELLEQKRSNDNLQKVVLATIFLFTIIITGLIISRQRRLNHRNRLLLEKDIQLRESQELLYEREASEKKRLLNELEQNNRFLIDFALYIGMKNEFLIGLRQQLRAIAGKTVSPDTIKNIIFQLNQNLRVNREMASLQENVERVNFSFIQVLTEKFPTLTENEKNLAILLRLNFSSKEIADLKAVSVKAVEMSRYRLKKKIQLSDHESLSHYIQSL